MPSRPKPRPNRPRWSRWLTAVAAALAAIMALAGCTSQTEPAAAPPWCGVWVDASGSTAGPTLSGYLATIRPFVQDCAERGARLHVDLITGNSQSDPVNPIDLTLHVDQNGSRLMNQARVKIAVDDVMSQINDRLLPQAGAVDCSDILGGMLDAGRVITNTPADDHHLLIATDGLTNCPRDGINLYATQLTTTADTERLLTTIDRHGLQARFPNTHITLVGIGQSPTAAQLPATQLNLLHQLWNRYGKRGGATIVRDTTTTATAPTNPLATPTN